MLMIKQETKLENSEEKLSASDKKWGYRYGERGLMTQAEAKEFMGCSRQTLNVIWSKGLIRKGRGATPKTVSFCRRSIEEYAASLEL